MGEELPRKGNSRYKGPEAGRCLEWEDQGRKRTTMAEAKKQGQGGKEMQVGIPETWLTRCQPWVPLGQSSLGLTEISLAVVGVPLRLLCRTALSPPLPQLSPGTSLESCRVRENL